MPLAAPVIAVTLFWIMESLVGYGSVLYGMLFAE